MRNIKRSCQNLEMWTIEMCLLGGSNEIVPFQKPLNLKIEIELNWIEATRLIESQIEITCFHAFQNRLVRVEFIKMEKSNDSNDVILIQLRFLSMFQCASGIAFLNKYKCTTMKREREKKTENKTKLKMISLSSSRWGDGIAKYGNFTWTTLAKATLESKPILERKWYCGILKKSWNLFRVYAADELQCVVINSKTMKSIVINCLVQSKRFCCQF